MANHLGMDVESKFDAQQFPNSSWVNIPVMINQHLSVVFCVKGEMSTSIVREKWPKG
jgi:hypothetical protein